MNRCVSPNSFFSRHTLVFRGDQQSRGLPLCRVDTHNYNLHRVCMCVCVYGVGWARTRIVSRPTAPVYSESDCSNTELRLAHIRETTVERTPTVSKHLLLLPNITARGTLLYDIFVKRLKQTQTPSSAETKICVCVFGYRERVMCGL